MLSDMLYGVLSLFDDALGCLVGLFIAVALIVGVFTAVDVATKKSPSEIAAAEAAAEAERARAQRESDDALQQTKDDMAADERALVDAIDSLDGTWVDERGNGFTLAEYDPTTGHGRFVLVGEPIEGFLEVDGFTETWSNAASGKAVECDFTAQGLSTSATPDEYKTTLESGKVVSARSVQLQREGDTLHMTVWQSVRAGETVLEDAGFTLKKR